MSLEGLNVSAKINDSLINKMGHTLASKMFVEIILS